VPSNGGVDVTKLIPGCAHTSASGERQLSEESSKGNRGGEGFLLRYLSIDIDVASSDDLEIGASNLGIGNIIDVENVLLSSLVILLLYTATLRTEIFSLSSPLEE